MQNTGTGVNCKKEGHCLHEGTAVGSMGCCKCGEYISIVPERLSYQEYGRRLRDAIDGHPEWGAKLL